MSFAESMDTGSDETCDDLLNIEVLLQFLVKVKHFINSASNTTDNNLLLINEAIKAISLDESTTKKYIPLQTVWKGFNETDMLNKIIKYTNLVLEVLLDEVKKHKADFQKLRDFQNKFNELRDCIFVYVSKKDYESRIVLVVKSLVDDILTEIGKLDMQKYNDEILVHNFFEYILSEFLRHNTFINMIMNLILQSFADIVEEVRTCEGHAHKMVNQVEVLNRYLNIVESTILMDVPKIRSLGPATLGNYRLILTDLERIEFLPKYFKQRVRKQSEKIRWY